MSRLRNFLLTVGVALVWLCWLLCLACEGEEPESEVLA